MGILYQASDPMVWAIWLFVVFALMAFNEFGRTSVWGRRRVVRGRAHRVHDFRMATHLPRPATKYGTGNWFNWAKTYSALAGCVGFMALRFVKWRGADGREHHLYEKRWALCFSAPHFGEYLRSRGARHSDVYLRPVGRRRRRPRVDDFRPVEHYECDRRHFDTSSPFAAGSASSSRKINRAT